MTVRFSLTTTLAEKDVQVKMLDVLSLSSSRQLAARGVVLDVQGAIEATIKSRPEWKAFVSGHESNYRQRLRE